LLLPPADDAEAEEVLIMRHAVETPKPPPWKSPVERQYEVFLGQLSVKARATIQKHDELCEAEGPPEHSALWKRFAGRLGGLAAHAVEAHGQHSVKFYIADGNYKLQVFALEDSRQGTIAVYFPDVVQAAVGEKILTGGTSSHHYKVPGAMGQLELVLINAETRDLTVCKAMVGWGRRARRVEFATPLQDAHIQAVEQMCDLAARKWVASTA
jgi:hypothetical protein